MAMRTYTSEPVDRREREIDHFTMCSTCGQPIDKRGFGIMLHHMDDRHAPLPAPEAFALVEDRHFKDALYDGRFHLTARYDA